MKLYHRVLYGRVRRSSYIGITIIASGAARMTKTIRIYKEFSNPGIDGLADKGWESYFYMHVYTLLKFTLTKMYEFGLHPVKEL